ncbi:AraC family transcriptional regulator [Paenibacillus sp. FSL M7-0896]|uniref:AraC family transcriptional regulator n=1 Tax=Paenibacillus sp. FSL M7-0896 TaxID=2921610 RepID=UPI0030D6CE24
MGCEFVDSMQFRNVTQSINRAREYIRLHLEENLTLNSCAQVVHLSPSYFAGAFKKENGMTLIQYITKLRIERALQLSEHLQTMANVRSGARGGGMLYC